MKLPHLDQIVLLERGEAGLLARAVAVLVQDVTNAKQPVPYLEMLTFTPFCNLGKKLLQYHRREQLTPARPKRFPKPKQLRVTYDQLAALHHHRFALNYCNLSPEENLQLQVILGKFQQKSLNLSRWVRF
ncbi:MAG: hypothetical protein ACRYFZ_18205 [Janthinobacterium lividum]